MEARIFAIPDAGGPAWLSVLLALPVLLLVVLAVVFWPRPLQVEITDSELRIRGSIYGRSVPRSQLQTARARIIDLAVDRELVPTLRTNGTALGNYQVGWFRLADRERALCFLTRRDSVLYVPTTENYALLLSTSSPAELLKAVQGGT
jgi:hypothetical protein